MIDLHAHVLPGLDDGPATLRQAVALVRAAGEAGTTMIAATPHIDRSWNLSPARVTAARVALCEALVAEGIDVTIVGGGEIALDRLVDLRPEELAELTLGESRTLLVECPLQPMAGDFTWPVRRLLEDGWSVVLAHPERSPGFRRDRRLLERLVADGARAQVTANALIGDFGQTARLDGLALLDAGLAHIVASDTHDVTARPPSLNLAHAHLQSEYPRLAARWRELTYDEPAAVLRDVPVAGRVAPGP